MHGDNPAVREALRQWARDYTNWNGRPPTVREWSDAKNAGPQLQGKITVADRIDPAAPVVDGEVV